MELSKRIDKILVVLVVSAILAVFSVVITTFSKNVFANNEDEFSTDQVDEEKFVIFYDNGDKLIVKTNAKTVGDAISRVGFILNDGDAVEPSLETEINANNFYINIHRARPVIVKDGVVAKYLMTASYDKKEIMKEAEITVYDGDEIALINNEDFLETGAANTYLVTRNGGRIVTEEEEIPFSEEEVKDYNLAPGTSEIRQYGEMGLKKIAYNILYVDGKEVSRELVSEEVVKWPVARIVAVGASEIERNPLTASKGRNRYTVKREDGTIFERQETYYDLNMSRVMQFRLNDGCGDGTYSVREDGVKIDSEGYVLVAANLDYYPLCTIVETSLGLGRVYDTGSFAEVNPEQFDIATDWTSRNGI